MEIRIVRETIPIGELPAIASVWYGDMLKGAVDIEREIVALGGEYHMDANQVLIESGSRQEAVWGFNIHLEKPRDEWIECRSLINIRPAQGNRDMYVGDALLRERMVALINRKIV